ncbi:hypothetical protein F5Y11DRAFT_201967 [Daldinia sp. FL1419]|nr:hypothetical protein F5Y11DRAFT_201967 [Daldinia sp. FL1419]
MHVRTKEKEGQKKPQSKHSAISLKPPHPYLFFFFVSFSFSSFPLLRAPAPAPQNPLPPTYRRPIPIHPVPLQSPREASTTARPPARTFIVSITPLIIAYAHRLPTYLPTYKYVSGLPGPNSPCRGLFYDSPLPSWPPNSTPLSIPTIERLNDYFSAETVIRN